MRVAEDGGSARAVRLTRLLSSRGRVATAWWGPVALGAFAIWRYSKTAPGGHDDLLWAAIFVAAAALALLLLLGIGLAGLAGVRYRRRGC